MKGKNHWDAYWEGGSKTSFGDARDEYDGTIEKVWTDVYSQLVAGQTSVDLCTGNASLLRIARKNLSAFDKVSFIGVDYSSIHLEEDWKNLTNVEFMFDTNVECLPIDDGSVDLITSNYGIEYSDLNKSLSECIRVLKPKGRLEILSHCFDSNIVIKNAKELELLVRMTREKGLISILESLLFEISLGSKGQALRKESKRIALNKEIESLVEGYQEVFFQNEFLEFLKFVLSAKSSHKLEDFEAYKKELLSHSLRLTSLVEAAITREQLERVSTIFEGLGACLTGKLKLQSNGEIIGVLLSAVKE